MKGLLKKDTNRLIYFKNLVIRITLMPNMTKQPNGTTNYLP